jgi:hypothetical protein
MCESCLLGDKILTPPIQITLRSPQSVSTLVYSGASLDMHIEYRNGDVRLDLYDILSLALRVQGCGSTAMARTVQIAEDISTTEVLIYLKFIL